MLPPKCQPHPESVWSRIEFDALKKNADVKEVIRVNLDDTSDTTTIWPFQTFLAARGKSTGTFASSSTCSLETASPTATATTNFGNLRTSTLSVAQRTTSLAAIITSPLSMTTNVVSTPISSSTQAPFASYQQGVCTFHLTQWQTMSQVLAGTGEYTCEITMKDDAFTSIIGYGKGDCASHASMEVGSKLEDLMIITPENQDDYIQFQVGSQAWPSNGDGSTPGCKVGDWNGSDDPGYREMDCNFYCWWSRGPCSDGSC